MKSLYFDPNSLFKDNCAPKVLLTLQNSLNRPLDKVFPQHSHISADRNAQDQITLVIIVLTHTLCNLCASVSEGLTGDTMLPLLESGRQR